jgi:hypothetical protein
MYAEEEIDENQYVRIDGVGCEITVVSREGVVRNGY